MIESGTGVIAACLPSLRFLFSQSSIDSILRSIRSTFSLQSHSSHTRSSRTSNLRRQTSEGSSVDHINHIDGISSLDSYAMKNLDGSEAKELPGRVIRVQNTLHQQESFV